mmetsp:Transcript_3097/g.8623  ORF Transcript_3097/g.8623 Transcript_3097/m.8623 type:complete len:318 (-) Transcript_3097:386-1339(-)
MAVAVAVTVAAACFCSPSRCFLSSKKKINFDHLLDNCVPAVHKLLHRDHIVCSNGHEILDRHHSIVVAAVHGVVEEPNGRTHTSAVYSVANCSRVGEIRHLHARLNVFQKHVLGVWLYDVLQIAAHKLCDVEQLGGFVVGEVNVVSDTRVHARNVGVETFHLVRVAGKHHHNIFFSGFHDVQQDFNGLLPVVTVVRSVVQVVGLVDKQNSAHCLFDLLFRFGSCVTHVLTHQIVTSGHDQMAFPGVSHLLEDLTDTHCNGGLTCSGGSCERHVKRGHSCFESKLAPHFINDEQRGNLADTRLHWPQTDEVVIELFEH